ncbi:hypothetical protein R3P38DRAFT_3243632 [Favolaschia claudopus]|uniref:Uncharacterized protein n=1 Tax=Favolaschia claudopus TaxID=2862362 RepID=A0AAV9Z2N8_9AGAR
MANPNFIAKVAEPPQPLIVPLAHTDFVAPTFPTLLMHEDLDSFGPPPQLPKRKPPPPKPQAPKKAVAFSEPPPSPLSEPPPSPPSDSSSGYEELTLSKVKWPQGGPSRVSDTDFPIITGWTPEFIAKFEDFVATLVARNFQPGISVTKQDQNVKKKVVDMVAKKFPEVDAFVGRWPIEKILIGVCKASAAKLSKAEKEKKVVEAVNDLHPRTSKRALQPFPPTR